MKKQQNDIQHKQIYKFPVSLFGILFIIGLIFVSRFQYYDEVLKSFKFTLVDDVTSMDETYTLKDKLEYNLETGVPYEIHLYALDKNKNKIAYWKADFIPSSSKDVTRGIIYFELNVPQDTRNLDVNIKEKEKG